MHRGRTNMTDLPHPWSEYDRLQASLARSSRIDSQTWGVEAALSGILNSEQICTTITPEQIATSCRTAARRERAQSFLRRKHVGDVRPQRVDTIAMLEA